MPHVLRCAMTIHRALVWAGRPMSRLIHACPAAVRPFATAAMSGCHLHRKRPLSLTTHPACTRTHRYLSTAPSSHTQPATSSDDFIVGLDSLPTLPMPTRAHPKVAPFPLSRLAFAGPIRSAVPLPTILPSLTSFLTAGCNVVELPRGQQREVAECVKQWQQERAEAGVEGGGTGCGDVLHVVSVGWRDVVSFIEERRVEWREQQRLDEELNYRRKRREQIKQQNIAAQQQLQQEQQLDSPTSATTTTPSLIHSSSISSTEQPPTEMEAGEKEAQEVVVEENEDELLPINRLELCHSDAPIDFANIDIFPYLHAHLTAVCHLAVLPDLPLVLLDDVDLVPEGVRDEYVSRWFIALEQCVLARRIRRYGVTSAHFTSRLPLHRCVEAAASILDEPHFAAIRFPLHVYDTRAMTERCCEDGTGGMLTVVQYAKQRGLLCIGDAGVDVVDRKGHEHRLVSASVEDDEDVVDGKTIAEQLKGAFNVSMFLEKQLQQMLEGREDELAGLGVDRMEVSWAHVMAAQMSLIDNAVRWDRLLHDTIQPTLDRALHRLSSHVSEQPGPRGTDEWERWCRDYRQCTTLLFSTFTASVAHASESEAHTVADWLDEQCGEVRQLGQLEHKVLLLALCSGVDVVCTSEVKRAVELLELGWKDEGLRAGSPGGQVDKRWPERWLSEQRALELMKEYEEQHS